MSLVQFYYGKVYLKNVENNRSNFVVSSSFDKRTLYFYPNCFTNYFSFREEVKEDNWDTGC
jgi:hypothetical protein